MTEGAGSVTKVIVKIGDREIELHGDAEHVSKVIAHLLAAPIAASPPSHKLPAESPPPGETPPPPPGGAPLKDIHQFFEEKKPSSDNEAVVSVAYYYNFIAPEPERSETINKDFLLKGLREARHPYPKRPAMALIHAKNAGYLSQSGKGTYRLTTVGHNLVAHTLGGGAAVAKAPRKSKPKRKPASKKAGRARKKAARRP